MFQKVHFHTPDPDLHADLLVSYPECVATFKSFKGADKPKGSRVVAVLLKSPESDHR
jgi:hypothetical protein